VYYFCVYSTLAGALDRIEVIRFMFLLLLRCSSAWAEREVLLAYRLSANIDITLESRE